MSFLKSNKLVVGSTKAFIFGKSISLDGHKHDEYATTGKVDGITGVVKSYPTITMPRAVATNNAASIYTIDLTDIGFNIYKALVTITTALPQLVVGNFGFSQIPKFGQEIELITGTTIKSANDTSYSAVASVIAYRSISLANNILTLSTNVVVTNTNYGPFEFNIPQHTWTDVTFKLFA